MESQSDDNNTLVNNVTGSDIEDDINNCNISGALVPTISVTPYSPMGKQYNVLEDNLQQLHDIVDAVQQMKDGNTLSVSNRLQSSDYNPRLSCSCPSLNEQYSDSEFTESEAEDDVIVSLLENDRTVGRESFLSYFQDNRRGKRPKRCSVFFKNVNKISDLRKTTGALLHSSVSERKDENSQDPNFSEDVPLVGSDFLDDGSVTCSDLEPFLGLQDDEPETWSLTVSKDVIKKLKEKDVKRQEHIYELIQSEKHHCLTLRVMQKIFVEGLRKHFNLGVNLGRMFPRLLDLTDIHLRFLYLLRERQREAPVVDEIGDILLEQFSGECAEKLKLAYGEFCSQHTDAVNIYKYYVQNDSKFAMFVKHCQNNPLLKKKGIPECILFVTQRLTKYPLLIEPLIKTSKENKPELEKLTKALASVKEILVTVDAKVEERERERKKMEIYNKVDNKSFTYYRGKKFKKISILSNNRTLQYEGIAMLMQGRSKMQLVQVVVLSDVLFFLAENNHKCTFFTPYGKEGVVPLYKLLVREKAGSDSRAIYLISSTLPNPEMYELKVQQPKDKQVWIKGIREAIRNCTVDDAESFDSDSSDSVQRIIESLQQKDLEQALIMEEKIALQLKLLTASGIKTHLNPPLYSHLLSEEVDNEMIHEEVVRSLQKVQELTGTFCENETSLSRSASSVGERQSPAYVSPILPKRAETFGGFDNATKDQNNKTNMVRKLSQQLHRKLETPVTQSIPIQPDKGSQGIVVEMISHTYTLATIVMKQMTCIDRLQAELKLRKDELDVSANGEVRKEKRLVYNHSQQLEELRNLQDKLTQEKEQWQAQKEADEKDLDDKRQQLQKLQEQVRSEQNDVTLQREQLYRKLELLSSQGVLMNSDMSSPPSMIPSPASLPIEQPPSPSDSLKRRSDSVRWKQLSSKPSTLPLNLISATNQQKASANVQVKQKLPLKLASTLGSNSPSGK